MDETRIGAWILAGTILLVTAIGCEGVRAPANAGSSESASSPPHEPGSPEPLETRGEVSAADRQAIFEAIEAREYWASADGDSVQAPNRRHDLRSHFEPTDVRVETRSGSEGPLLVELRLARLGRGEEFVAVGPGEVRHEAARVEIARPELDLVEWFENSPEGLEQGFTLGKRLAGEARALVLELAVAFCSTGRDESDDQAEGLGSTCPTRRTR